MQSCCTKLTCIGCFYASIKYGVQKEIVGERTCPFCRQPEPKTKEEIERYKMKRRKVNDPVAILEAGKRSYHQGDHENALDDFKKAAELGDVEAHYCLSFMYRDGNGVDKVMAKRLQLKHLEEAERIERAVNHFTIAAHNGHDDSAKALGELHAAGHVSKEDYELALRAYQDAIDASNSPQREAALAAMQTLG
eukprot:scaffold9947_cov124-Skeletonema_menzelii.AAC.5